MNAHPGQVFPIDLRPLPPPPMSDAEIYTERATLTLLRSQIRSIATALPPSYARMRVELTSVCALLSNYISALDGSAG